jgi:hypothetical protein
MSQWVENSIAKPIAVNLNNDLIVIGLSVTISINAVIILHSWSLHGFPRGVSKFSDLLPKSTRAKTELAAFSTLLCIIFAWIGARTTSATVYAVFSDYLKSGLFGVIIQLCDSYMS